MSEHVFAKRERDLVVTGAAVFRVELEVSAGGVWTRDTTHAQIDTQVLDAAQEKLGKLVEKAIELGIQIRLSSKPVHVRTVVDYVERKEGR